MEITLSQMLTAREERAFRQFFLNRQWGKPMVSFSMNIPGPVKDTPLIRRGFGFGLDRLEALLPAERILYRQVIEAVTGWEAVLVVDLPAGELKAITTAIEDETKLGRLFDMDVLDATLNKLNRETVGGKSRDCIVCGAPGRGCASRRLHSVPQLQAAVRGILTRHFAEADAPRIAALAEAALRDEVHTTPKPGLVDRRNCGSHTDMDQETFLTSARALTPYFETCVRIGMETAGLLPRETFPRLRAAGLEAEQTMYAATGGVNTHKGAIFTLGVLCGCVGRLWKPEGGLEAGEIFREVSAMTAEAMEGDFSRADGSTVGQRLYASGGIRGIRGEVAQGLPSVAQLGLPVYREYRAAGWSKNDAGVRTLLHLIASVEDTCLIHRGGRVLAREAAQRTAALLRQGPETAQVEALDDWFIERNLSPGGCADLLAVVYFMESLCGEGGFEDDRA